MEGPMPVVVTVLMNEDKVLLINRKRGAYPCMWALPGGKIEKNELLKDAAIREVFEETGLKAEFVKLRGVVSEHYFEEDKLVDHFLLNICVLKPLTREIKHTAEGELQWFDLFKIDKVEKIIPSDLQIIKKMILRNFTYFNSVLEKRGGNYILREFC